jgi:hypothetical protein
MEEGFVAQLPVVPEAVAELDSAMDSNLVRLGANMENGDRLPIPTAVKTPQFSISNEEYEEMGQQYHDRQRAWRCIVGAVFAGVFVVFLGIIISNVNGDGTSSYWTVGTGDKSSYHRGYGTYNGFTTDDMY